MKNTKMASAFFKPSLRRTQSKRFFACTIYVSLVAMVHPSFLMGEDWPMWRYDASRTAASPNQLPAELNSLWTIQSDPREQAWDDPLNLDLMTYDKIFEPIITQGVMIVPYNEECKVVAYDLLTGSKLWTFFAEAPIRLPAASESGSVCFVSDDGHLYCLDAMSGNLQWSFFGAPSKQHAIGNRRLVSAWPARGGPVIREGSVYFSSSIWPFMGVFIYSLDLETGNLNWVNDRIGSQYIKQPHSAPSFAGVAPQGVFVATDKRLIVPGGRSVPAVFNRISGDLQHFELNAGGKGNGGSFVAASEDRYFVHTRNNGTRAFSMADGSKQGFTPNEPVLSANRVFSAEQDDNGSNVIQCYGKGDQLQWSIKANGTGDLIQAGDQLVAAGGGLLSVIDLPRENQPAKVTKTLSIEEDVERLLLADETLVLVTQSGAIRALGQSQSDATVATTVVSDDSVLLNEQANHLDSQAITTAHQLLDQFKERQQQSGYSLWFGNADSETLKAFILQSEYDQVIVVDPDLDAVARLRRWLDDHGLHGRVTAHHSQFSEFLAPKYVASAVICDFGSSPESIQTELPNLYESVRPYGGVLCLLGQAKQQQFVKLVEACQLEQGQLKTEEFGVLVERVGRLPGSADWTHQYGDAANTIKSDDQRVKLPLGVLWFGGSSHLDVLPRHGHGPPEQVVGGRLFIQGIDCLSARDVYTGRVLWKREFEDLGTFDVYYDSTFEETPLNPKYNQVHIPGANGRGTNYVVTEDRVYIAEGRHCHVLDPATGETLVMIELPRQSDEREKDEPARDRQEDSLNEPEWGYLAVYEDVLIGGLGFADYRQRYGLPFDEDKELTRSRAGFGAKSVDRAASQSLVGFDRYTGELLWNVQSEFSFWHNGIAAGGEQIYCLDRFPARVEQALMRRGTKPSGSYRIAAFDYRTGDLNWEVKEGVFGTWLSYSEEFDLLLQAGSAASDRLTDETSKGMAVYFASDGSVKWKNENLRYTGPCILHHDWIITNTNSYAESAGAFFLHDGRQKMVPHPITGQPQPWRLKRAYGCNHIIASENMLTFRSGAAGYYDLLNDGGTGNLGGFKSGCTSNLVVANGVLNAPDYTRTCSCAYQNQTSLALVHMPDVDVWSVDEFAAKMTSGETVERLGVNFGAPGDRRHHDGTLWVEYPVVAGASPPIAVEWNPEVSVSRRHSSRHGENGYSWVFASGLKNVTNLRLRLKDAGTNLNGKLKLANVENDAEENITDGSVSLTSSDLEMSEEDQLQLIGLRFEGVPFSEELDKPIYLQFTCDEISKAPTQLVITAQATGNSKSFQAADRNLSSRARTKSQVPWQVQPWTKVGESGLKQRSPDIRSLLNEVLQRSDWQAGQALTLFVQGEGKRVACAFDGDEKKSPCLIFDELMLAERESDTLQEENHYQVKLFFTIPEDYDSCDFKIGIQGQSERRVSRLASEATQSKFEVVTVDDVKIRKDLRLSIQAISGTPLLSGVEIIRQESVKND
ncbi:PQQ-binding-like beta-propeller repeat protein [bacterium]|nr:PQQ-binding-like beta-propeller repeat protein [bacterium]